MNSSVQLFKALADETRLRILGLLREGELCVCDVMKVLELPQSKVSRHLAYLRNAGLVTGRREGVWMHYRLTQPEGTLQFVLLEWLVETRDEIPNGAEDSCALANVRARGEVCAEAPVNDRVRANRAPATANV